MIWLDCGLCCDLFSGFWVSGCELFVGGRVWFVYNLYLLIVICLWIWGLLAVGLLFYCGLFCGYLGLRVVWFVVYLVGMRLSWADWLWVGGWFVLGGFACRFIAWFVLGVFACRFDAVGCLRLCVLLVVFGYVCCYDVNSVG